MLNPKIFLIFAQKVQYNTLLDMKIQEVMKLQRKALGITQQDLADMSEIAISTIKKIESGKGNPSLSTVEKIMDILGMEVKYEIRQTVYCFLPAGRQGGNGSVWSPVGGINLS